MISAPFTSSLDFTSPDDQTLSRCALYKLLNLNKQYCLSRKKEHQNTLPPLRSIVHIADSTSPCGKGHGSFAQRLRWLKFRQRSTLPFDVTLKAGNDLNFCQSLEVLFQTTYLRHLRFPGCLQVAQTFDNWGLFSRKK